MTLHSFSKKIIFCIFWKNNGYHNNVLHHLLPQITTIALLRETSAVESPSLGIFNFSRVCDVFELVFLFLMSGFSDNCV